MRVASRRALRTPSSVRGARPPSPSPSSWRRCVSRRRSFESPCLVHRLVLVVLAVVDEARSFHEGADIVQRDAAINLQECSFDDVFQLRGVQGARTGEREQVPPGLWSEPATLMRTQHAKSHDPYSSMRLTAQNKKGRNLDACSIDPLPSGPKTHQQSWSNVGLPPTGGKLRYHSYNIMQVIEFRIDHVIGGLIRLAAVV